LKPVTLEATATTTSGGQLRPFVISQKLNFISNDSSDYDLKINFDGTVDQTGTFTLKAGEAVSDINMSCSSISVQGVGGSVSFRALGV
jgi:hypothetical protein